MKKYFFYTFLILLFFLVFGISLLSVDHNNKFAKYIKDQTPSEIKVFLKKTIFFIPNTKREIKQLEISLKKTVKKNELLILERDKFNNVLNSGKLKFENYNNEKYKFFSVILPFNNELDLYSNKKSGYIELYDKYIIVFFTSGKIIFLNKEDFFKGVFNFITVESNFNDSVLFDQKLKWTGIKDIAVEGNDVFVSVTEEIETNCYNTSLYQSKINKRLMDFKKIYIPDDCFNLDRKIEAFKYFNGYQTGGRIKVTKNKIYLTNGDYNTWEKVQDNESSAGKIIEFDRTSLKKKIISMGHRNPQGLYLNKDKNILISTEHGPKGGDEVNIIKLDQNLIQNFGWPISSYGNHYDSIPINSFTNEFAPLNKSHKNFNFIEPIKYFIKSIGISEIIANYNVNNSFFITSLKNNTIYEMQLDNNLNFLAIKNKTKLNERIRDIIYDYEKNCYLIYAESTPKLISMCPID
jgi:hypothetical protein